MVTDDNNDNDDDHNAGSDNSDNNDNDKNLTQMITKQNDHRAASTIYSDWPVQSAS